eukprot:3525005-Pleurochrysis_carterae.AAC.1
MRDNAFDNSGQREQKIPVEAAKTSTDDRGALQWLTNFSQHRSEARQKDESSRHARQQGANMYQNLRQVRISSAECNRGRSRTSVFSAAGAAAGSASAMLARCTFSLNETCVLVIQESLYEELGGAS